MSERSLLVVATFEKVAVPVSDSEMGLAEGLFVVGELVGAEVGGV